MPLPFSSTPLHFTRRRRRHTLLVVTVACYCWWGGPLGHPVSKHNAAATQVESRVVGDRLLSPSKLHLTMWPLTCFWLVPCPSPLSSLDTQCSVPSERVSPLPLSGHLSIFRLTCVSVQAVLSARWFKRLPCQTPLDFYRHLRPP